MVHDTHTRRRFKTYNAKLQEITTVKELCLTSSIPALSLFSVNIGITEVNTRLSVCPLVNIKQLTRMADRLPVLTSLIGDTKYSLSGILEC